MGKTAKLQTAPKWIWIAVVFIPILIMVASYAKSEKSTSSKKNGQKNTQTQEFPLPEPGDHWIFRNTNDGSYWPNGYIQKHNKVVISKPNWQTDIQFTTEGRNYHPIEFKLKKKQDGKGVYYFGNWRPLNGIGGVLKLRPVSEKKMIGYLWISGDSRGKKIEFKKRRFQ